MKSKPCTKFKQKQQQQQQNKLCSSLSMVAVIFTVRNETYKNSSSVAV